MVIPYLLFFAIGSLSGFLSGLLGISGGFLTVPLLFLLFSHLHLAPEHLMQLSIGTSLAAMIFNTFISAFVHSKQKKVEWSIVKKMAPTLFLGSIAGALVGHLLPTPILKMVFGFCACVFGVYIYMYATHPPSTKIKCSPSHLYYLGFGVGALSNILGIGGGTITVPFFLNFSLSMHRSIATSAVTGFMVTFMGALGYLSFGLHQTLYPQTLGYIYLPAFFTLAPGACLLAPLGAKLTYSLKGFYLKRLFSCFLILMGLGMLLR